MVCRNCGDGGFQWLQERKKEEEMEKERIKIH